METCGLCDSERKLCHHHLSYNPEKIILLCYSCHVMVHALARISKEKRVIMIQTMLNMIETYSSNWNNGTFDFLKSQYKKERYSGEYNKEYYQKNKERLKKQQKEYYQKNKGYNKEYYQKNKEHIKNRQREYIKNNQEHRKEYLKGYCQKNKGHRKEYLKRWRVVNKEKVKEYNKKAREKRALKDLL